MQECMSRLCIKAAKYNYKEHARWLKEHDICLKEYFFNDIENDEIMQEI